MLMKMTSDLDLLGQFARQNSQDAFTALVNRHVNLVYSAALRQVRSPQFAEEIAQSVFADLARDAGKLKSNTVLTNQLTLSPGQTVILEQKIPAGMWSPDLTNTSSGSRSLLVFVTPTVVKDSDFQKRR